jgi:pimeloyl-ACP methyl ester carboxylesterase
MRFVGLMASLEWGEQVHRITAPTLVVIPGNETVGPASNYDVMRADMPDAEFVTFDGLPHNICDAVPRRCAKAALAFLERRFP